MQRTVVGDCYCCFHWENSKMLIYPSLKKNKILFTQRTEKNGKKIVSVVTKVISWPNDSFTSREVESGNHGWREKLIDVFYPSCYRHRCHSCWAYRDHQEQVLCGSAARWDLLTRTAGNGTRGRYNEILSHDPHVVSDHPVLMVEIEYLPSLVNCPHLWRIVKLS